MSALSLFKPEHLKTLFQNWLQDIWHNPPPSPFSVRGIWVRLVRMIHLVITGFGEDQLRLHASALTYATLVTLIPLVALSLAVLKGLGYDTELSSYLTEYTSEMPAQFKNLSEQILQAISNANFARIGGTGAAVLTWMAIQMLARIEQSFNNVWHVTRSRSWLRRITNYISVIVVVPILMITAIGVSAQLNFGEGLIGQLGLVRAAPFLFTWLAFGFLYGTMPNTRVGFMPAMVSGLIGAALWHYWFQFYITVQPGVTRYNVIYGTLASVPIFLVWLYMSWSIVLLGAKVAFAVQNGGSFQPDDEPSQVNIPGRMALALEMLMICARHFRGEGPRFQEEQFAQSRHLPPAILEHLVYLLEEHQMIAAAGEGEWLLARDPDLIEMSGLWSILLQDGQNDWTSVEADQTIKSAVAAQLDAVPKKKQSLSELLNKAVVAGSIPN